MRILALDHGTKRIGVAVSDETKIIAQPLEYISAEPFAGFLERLKKLLIEKEVDLILIGMPRRFPRFLRLKSARHAGLLLQNCARHANSRPRSWKQTHRHRGER